MSYPDYPSTQPQPPVPKKRIWPWILGTLSAVLLLALTFGIGTMAGSDEEPVASPPTGETVDIESPAANPAASSNQAPPAAGGPLSSTTELTSSSASSELTDRGTIPMKPGAVAIEKSPEGKQLATWKVNSIKVDPVCTGSYVQQPANGHFVVMDVSVEVAPYGEINKYPNLYKTVSTRQGGFRMVDPTGKTMQGNDIIGNGYGCLPEGSAIPSDINAGEKASGTLVFDVPTEKGSIILPELLGGDPSAQGWEWSYQP